MTTSEDRPPCAARRSVDRFRWERIIRRERLSGATKGVARALAFYADPDGTRVFPRVPELMESSGYGRRTVVRALAELRQLDLIAPELPDRPVTNQLDDITRIRYWARRKLPTHYRLTLPVPYPTERLWPVDQPPDPPPAGDGRLGITAV